MRLTACALAFALIVSAPAPAPAPVQCAKCASTLAELPPYEGVYQPRGVDEIGLWQKDDESERLLAASALVIRDEALTNYVKGVLCETVGNDRCHSVRVYIMRDPTFNATMSPNGTLRVLSGLFLRVHNEAELGAVLGHEFGHFEKRHVLTSFKSARSATDLLAWAGVLAGWSSTDSARESYRHTALSVYGSLYRNSRDHEREADRQGIAYLNRSNLPPQGASRVWRNVMAEAEASAQAKGLGKPNFNAIAFTASHPPDGERAAYLAALADPAAASRDDGASRYNAALARWLPVFMEDQIKLNDFGGSDYLIRSLAEPGWTAWLWHARGELYRGRGNQRDLANAADFYANAVKLDPNLAEAWRGLGLSLIKTGQTSPGRKALARYLQLKPDAADAKIMALLIPQGT